jgi:hypothetical protein
VHSDVNALVQQGVINLLGEKALPTDVCKRLVEDLVTSCLDDNNL